MKKLIIALTIAMSAVVSFGAAANWAATAKDIYNGTGSSEESALYSGSAYIFDAGITSQSTLYALIVGGTSIGSSTAGYITTASISDGVIGSTAFTYGDQSPATGAKNYYDYYFVIVDSKKAYFSGVKNVAANAKDTAKSVLFGSQDNGTATFSSVAPTGSTFAGEGYWSKTVSVPEPTSGLMMLIGVGLMALKRKRA